MVVATALLAAVAEVPLDIAGKFPFQFIFFLLNVRLCERSMISIEQTN
jgi:hypothetical protein